MSDDPSIGISVLTFDSAVTSVQTHLIQYYKRILAHDKTAASVADLCIKTMSEQNLLLVQQNDLLLKEVLRLQIENNHLKQLINKTDLLY